MSGNAQDSGSPLRGRMGRLSRGVDATTLVKKGLNTVGGSFTRGMESIINKPTNFQNRMASRDASVYTKGVRELDKYGYEKYNIGAEGSEIFISMTSDKVSFNDGDPMMVRGTDGNYIGNADVNWIDHTPDEVKEPENINELFPNAARGSGNSQSYVAEVGINNKGTIVPNIDSTVFSRMRRGERVETREETVEVVESVETSKPQMDVTFLNNLASGRNVRPVTTAPSISLEECTEEVAVSDEVDGPIIIRSEMETVEVEEESSNVASFGGFVEAPVESETPVRETAEVASFGGFVEVPYTYETIVDEEPKGFVAYEYTEEIHIEESEKVTEIHQDVIDGYTIGVESEVEENIEVTPVITGAVVEERRFIEDYSGNIFVGAHEDPVIITEVVPETTVETVPEVVVVDSVPSVIVETIPERIEVVPETTVETVPEVVIETIPETVVVDSVPSVVVEATPKKVEAVDDSELVAKVIEDAVAESVVEEVVNSAAQEDVIVDAMQIVAEQKAAEENLRTVPATMAVVEGAVKVETSAAVTENRTARIAIDADGEALPQLSEPKRVRQRSVRFKFNADGVLTTFDAKEEPKGELRSPLE